MAQALKSIAQIRLAGNPSNLTKTELKRREKMEAQGGEDQSVPGSPGRPRCPEQIKADPAALAAWKEATRLLRKRGTLAATDAPLLVVYSLVYSKCMQSNADIASRGFEIEVERASKNGEVYTTIIPNPSVRIATDCERQLLALAKALGLSPDTREKVRPTRRAPKKEKWSPSMLKAGTMGAYLFERGMLDPKTGKPIQKAKELV